MSTQEGSQSKAPDCYKCVHRSDLPGDCHSRCNNHSAKVKGNPHGIRNGWFAWPVNYDPVWLVSCDGFSDNEKDRKPSQPGDPFLQLAAYFARRL